jgi:hypothetical protein
MGHSLGFDAISILCALAISVSGGMNRTSPTGPLEAET